VLITTVITDNRARFSQKTCKNLEGIEHSTSGALRNFDVVFGYVCSYTLFSKWLVIAIVLAKPLAKHHHI
jgi:hypothetical protein